jgi:hypothetical protein
MAHALAHAEDALGSSSPPLPPSLSYSTEMPLSRSTRRATSALPPRGAGVAVGDVVVKPSPRRRARDPSTPAVRAAD